MATHKNLHLPSTTPSFIQHHLVTPSSVVVLRRSDAPETGGDALAAAEVYRIMAAAEAEATDLGRSGAPVPVRQRVWWVG